jgi:hypothetical protein
MTDILLEEFSCSVTITPDLNKGIDMLAFIILIAGALTRLTDHAPNFTPTIALALFGGVYLPRKYAVVVPVIFMFVSDIFLGFHDTMLYTWGSVFLISLLGWWVRERKSLMVFLGTGVVSSVLFFIVTNFGAWPTLYPLTWQGFVDCYVAAVPFFRNTFVSTILYCAVFYGVYELIAARVRHTRWAGVLLAA